MRFSRWLVGTGSIPSPAWAQALLSLILSDVFTLAQCSFITYMCWSVLCWILSGGPLQIWLTLCVTLPSLVLCPTDASCLIFLDPQFREFTKLCLGFWSLCCSLDALQAVSWTIVGLTLFLISQGSLSFVVWWSVCPGHVHIFCSFPGCFSHVGKSCS